VQIAEHHVDVLIDIAHCLVRALRTEDGKSF